MGNEISHKRYCCRKSRKFERLAAERDKRGAHLPVAQAYPGAVLWSSANHPPEDKPQDGATGMRNKNAGMKSETASSSMPVAQVTVRSTERGEAQPSGEQSEDTENKPTATLGPASQACAPAQERPAGAQQAEGDTAVTTTDLPPRATTEAGAPDAEDAATDQGRAESSPAARRRPRHEPCKLSPLCRWLKKLQSPAGKAKVKPDATPNRE